jgi:protein LTV1
MPHRRKFLDKKNAITFQLVHRSQHDPLIADDTVGERVLVPLAVSFHIIEEISVFL